MPLSEQDIKTSERSMRMVDAAHASQIELVSSKVESTAELIDRETGLCERIEILEEIITEAGGSD